MPPLGQRLLRSTPTRLTLLIVSVVAVVNLISLGAAWVTLRNDALVALRSDLERDLQSFDVSASPGALRTLVRARARATDPADTVFVFVGDDGGITGNARAVIDTGGTVRFFAMSRQLPLSDAGYVEQSRRLSGGVLIVAESLAPVASLDRTFLILLMFSTLPTIALSLLIGGIVARASARRVARIEGALERIASGDLGARVRAAGGDDLARIGERVDRMAARQQAATEALRQVTTDIAHDLRTPLQRIGVTLQDLETRLEGRPERALATEAAAEAGRAVAVFRALLQIAQIEGGQGVRDPGPVDLVAVARQITELYEPTAEDGGFAVTLDLPDTPVEITGDGDLIGQALANLIENALRHTPSGGDIRVAVRAETAGAVLTVADTGPGIPEAERANVLRRLYRLERSRTTPGNGLGLSLVAAIVERHGGTLELADNAPGLLVTLRFPT